MLLNLLERLSNFALALILTKFTRLVGLFTNAIHHPYRSFKGSIYIAKRYVASAYRQRVATSLAEPTTYDPLLL